MADEGVNEKAPFELAVVVPKVVLEDIEPLNRVKVTFELGSALPLIVGVESFGEEVLTIDVGGFGAVLSNELVPDPDESIFPVLVDLSAKVSIGNNRSKPNDDKTVAL